MGEALDCHRGASPFAGRGAVVVLHRCHASPLPKSNEPHRNKQKGQNKTEEELAVVDHDLIDVVNADVRCTCAEHNVVATTLSRVKDCARFFCLAR